MKTISSARPRASFATSASKASDYAVCNGAAALLIDATRRLIAASTAGRDILLRDPRLTLCHDRLSAAERSDIARIEYAIMRALYGAPGEPWLLFDENPDDLLRIDFTAIHGDLDPPQLLVTLASARIERSRRVAEAVLGYNLTPCEARMLDMLFDGCSVPQAALRLGVAPSTARTHLQRLFDKTGARRQGDLLRLVAAPAIGCAMVD